MPSQRRSGVVLGYANVATKNLVNLAYVPMLLSFVGRSDYGVYQSCNSFVFSLALLSFGFSQAYVRFYTQKKVHGTESDIRRLNGVYLVLYMAVSALALGLGLVFAANASAVFSTGFTAEEVSLAGSVMSLMACNIAVTLFNSVFDAHMLARERFRFQQTRQLGSTLATPLIVYLLLCAGTGVVGVAAAQLAVNVVLLGLNAIFCVGHLGMRFDVRHFDKVLFRSIAAFSAWIFANQVCDLINQNVPNVLLGALSGASAVAVFAVSVQIRSVFMSLSTVMSNVFTPKINKIVAESDDNVVLTDLMARVGRYQMLLFCWVYGGFAVLGRFFLASWAGDGFEDVYWLVLVMVAPLAFPLTQNTGIDIQRAKNRHKARSVVYLVAAVANLAITASLAGRYGYWAPVAGYVFYVLFACGLFMNWYYQKRIGLDMVLFWKRVLPVAACGVAATVACLLGSSLLPVTGWVSFAAWGCAYSAIYAALALALAADGAERKALRNAAARLARRNP